jgi:hypothetical protein
MPPRQANKEKVTLGLAGPYVTNQEFELGDALLNDEVSEANSAEEG